MSNSMSAAKHTPWHVTPAMHGRVPAKDHFELRDATGTHAHSMSRESLQALADKLNATSDLLEALQNIVMCSHRRGDAEPADAYADRVAMLPKMVAKGVAAIAKATGSAT